MKPLQIYVVLIILFTATSESFAQNNRANKDTDVVDELNLNAWKIRNSNLELSKQYALSAIDKSEKLNYKKGLSFSLNVLGNYFKAKGLYDSSLIYYTKSLLIRKSLRDTIGILSSLRNVMSIYKLKGNYDSALQNGLAAIELTKTKPNDNKIKIEKGRIQYNLSAIYLKRGNYRAAIQQALEAKSIFSNNGMDEDYASVLMTIGNIYEQQMNYTNALFYFNETARIHKKSGNQKELAKAYNCIGNIYYSTYNNDSALYYYKQGLSIRFKNGFEDDLSGSLYNIGNIYVTINNYDSALFYFKSSLNIAVKSGKTEALYEAHEAIAEILILKKYYREALSHLQQAFSLSSSSKALPEKLILLKQLSNVYKAIGKKDSAFIYSDEYSQLNDSLNEVLRKSIELEGTIKSKELELNLSEEKNRSQMYIIIGMTAAIVLMVIILLLIYHVSKSGRNMRKLQDIIKEQELIALDAMLEGQESERKRLSRELHDTIGSILAATKFAFKSMENSLEKLMTENNAQYQNINGMLDEAMETVRKISHDMASGIIMEKGIEGALSQLCKRLEVSGKLKISLIIFGFDDKVDPVVELELYRVVQELLTNILKHAQAQNVSIQLTKSQSNINLMVEDDGTGFNPTNTKKAGIGLKNIDERLKKLNGKWNIDSGKGRGTTVIVDVPINNEKN
ncbi:MAG: tetratricopeptide repeat protein [Bacteroidia bacterium]|nr:tetratricopeptide repeat protein [Bacteroidia bacterium]